MIKTRNSNSKITIHTEKDVESSDLSYSVSITFLKKMHRPRNLVHMSVRKPSTKFAGPIFMLEYRLPKRYIQQKLNAYYKSVFIR